MRQVNVYDAKTHFSELLDAALGGEDVVIARHGKPIVRLVPFAPGRPLRRTPGGLKGRITFADDWDAPMTDDELAEWEDGPLLPAGR